MVLVGDACIRNGRRSLALEQPGLRGAIEVGGQERVVVSFRCCNQLSSGGERQRQGSSESGNFGKLLQEHTANKTTFESLQWPARRLSLKRQRKQATA
jgi:hypothetical protein